MRSFGKFIAWLIGIIILLYLIMALVLHFMIKPETYKSWLEKVVYQQTGHKLIINGALEWSTFPNPTIKMTQVVVENEKDQAHIAPYFAKVKEVDLQISLLHLFSGEIVPTYVILHEAQVNLIYHSATHNSITQLQQKSKSSQSPTATGPQPSASKSNAQLSPALKLGDDATSHKTYLQHMKLPKVLLTNSSINWIDLKNNKITKFNDINVTIQPEQTSAFIKGSVTITQQPHTLKLKLSTTLTHSLDNTLVKLENLSFSGTDSNGKLTNSLDYKGDISADFNKQTVSLPSYHLTWNQLPMHGKIDGNWTTTNNQLSATITASTKLADGMINEKATYVAPDKGHDSLNYLISIHHINLAPVLKSIHYDHLLQGVGSLTAHMSANNSGKGWVSNLNGAGNFRLTDTKLGQLNSTQYLNQALQLLHQSPLENNGVTVFSNISGSFTLHNGVFYNNDLKLEAKKVTSTGAGNINFNTHTINYRLKITPKNNKNNFVLPLNVTGSLQHPKVTPDLENIGKELLQNSIKQKVFKNLFHDKKINIDKIF